METAKTLLEAKSRFCYTLKKKDCTGELNNMKRPGTAQDTTNKSMMADPFLSATKKKKNPLQHREKSTL